MQTTQTLLQLGAIRKVATASGSFDPSYVASELLTCAFGVNIARKIPKNVMEAEYSKKMNQNSKKLRPEFVATPPIVKHTEQKRRVETQR